MSSKLSGQHERCSKFTVAVFGDSGVGKSSIVRSFVNQSSIQEHMPTVEEFYVTQINHGKRDYELHIIDTSGTYEFPAMRKVAIHKADAAILVYSLDRPNSFKKLERYMEEIQSCFRERNRKIPVMIVSNKADLPNLSEPTFLDDKKGLEITSREYIESTWECQWLASSARFNLNVATIFHKLLEKLCPAENKKILSRSGTIFKAMLRH
ncbi:GTP-binding protein Di-Ras2-like [Montipora foliosa]|uniref:GTP-binding protein Di-Ras2-like n=1 Tax=Montipora foliosa TaxID=591990 RepID=UPI0035F212DD